jgi:hypothetical protein
MSTMEFTPCSVIAMIAAILLFTYGRRSFRLFCCILVMTVCLQYAAEQLHLNDHPFRWPENRIRKMKRIRITFPNLSSAVIRLA